VSAEIAGYPFESEQQEQRFMDLSEKLRCLVCQNQNLADSNAGLARDLRMELYEQVIKGNSETEIINFMTDRYGDFILYQPRFALKNIVLWLGPFLLFFIGVWGLVQFTKKTAELPAVQIDADKLQQVRELLEAEVEKK
jgi:cytochrome c-type biogenesis protein CcmH